MALKFHDPGGSALGGTQLLDTISGSFTAQTSVLDDQAYAYLATTGAGPANVSARKNAILQAAGNRCSVRFRVPAYPSINTAALAIGVTPTGSSNPLLVAYIGTDGKIRLYTNSDVTILGAASTTVLSTSTWYRVTLCYAITSTSNWGAKVYIANSSGTLLETMTRTHADGTLSSASPTDLFLGSKSTAGTNFLLYLSAIWVDDTTSQADPGNVHVSRRAPTTVSSGAWDTTTGTGSLIERPVDTANRIGQLATSAATVDYNVEAASAGDANLTGVTILGVSAFAWYTLSSLTGTPTGKLRVNGTAIGAVMDPAVAGTYQIHHALDTITTYPTTVGCTSSGIAADTLLAELGVIVSYIPIPPTPATLTAVVMAATADAPDGLFKAPTTLTGAKMAATAAEPVAVLTAKAQLNAAKEAATADAPDGLFKTPTTLTALKMAATALSPNATATGKAQLNAAKEAATGAAPNAALQGKALWTGVVETATADAPDGDFDGIIGGGPVPATLSAAVMAATADAPDASMAGKAVMTAQPMRATADAPDGALSSAALFTAVKMAATAIAPNATLQGKAVMTGQPMRATVDCPEVTMFGAPPGVDSPGARLVRLGTG